MLLGLILIKKCVKNQKQYNMNEKQLQAKMVMAFSQKYPEKKGQLFSVRNTTLSLRDGQTQKAMGMVAGVSDLIFHEDGGMVGIEIKVKGEKHKRGHVMKQYVWGETITRTGGEYYIATTVVDFMNIIEGGALNKTVYQLADIKKLLDTEKSVVIF